MICNSTGCGKVFENGDTVYGVVDKNGEHVACCSHACATVVEQSLRQRDMFVIIEELVYRVDEVIFEDSVLLSASTSAGKAGFKTNIKIGMPGNASLDRIREFGQGAFILTMRQDILETAHSNTTDEKSSPGREITMDEHIKVDIPDVNSLAGAIFQSITQKEDAYARWNERRETGLPDVVLKNVVIEEIGDGYETPENDRLGEMNFIVTGGKSPSIIRGIDPTAKPELKGKAFLDLVRDIMKVRRSD